MSTEDQWLNEPWRIDQGVVEDKDGKWVFDEPAIFGDRIVACVNACAGIPTAELRVIGECLQDAQARVESLRREVCKIASMIPSPYLIEVADERARQDEKWGGADARTWGEWGSFMRHRVDLIHKAFGFRRRALIELAALCIAAVESIDRKAARGDEDAQQEQE